MIDAYGLTQGLQRPIYTFFSMRISHSYKTIFFAVPRTGSTSVRKILDPYADVASRHVSQITEDHPFYHHMSPRELRTVFADRNWNWDAYRKFCLVRNPFDRVVSLFHHRLRQNDSGTFNRLLRRLRVRVRRPQIFSAYVSTHIRDWGRLETPVSAFIHDEEGRTLVDDVLQFERMKDELPRYLTSLGIDVSPADIPHANSSNRRDYSLYYTELSRSIVASVYQDDIKTYGYKF